MLLHDLFVALYTQDSPLLLLDTTLRAEDLLFARKKLLQSYRDLRGTEGACKAYDEFLAFCTTCLNEETEKPTIYVLFNYLKSTHITISDHHACKKLTELFFIAFQNESDMLSIASMGREFIDSPKTLAAFLRCLIWRNASPMNILSTQLLQDYLRYYLGSLHEENNEVAQLYTLLEGFSDTSELVMLSRKTRCKEDGLTSYALDGEVRSSLEIISQTMARFQLTSDATNLKNLHMFFNVTFLTVALFSWPNQKQDQIFKSTIINIFNQPAVVTNQLTELFSLIQSLDNPLHKIALIEILSEKTLYTLVNKKIVYILSLIPFSPYLSQVIQAKDLQNYLNELHQSTYCKLALISNLFTLFEELKTHQPSKAKIVVDAILNASLEDPSALDDNEMLRKLHKFSETALLVQQKIKLLEDSLDATIVNNTQHGPSEIDYILIEDIWRDASSKIRALQQISMSDTSCPIDKYELYNKIALAFFMHDPHLFNLDEFIEALKIEKVIDNACITPYERTLIELIVSIDNESLRNTCLSRLTEEHKPLFISKKDSVFFRKASEAGNLGFIQSLIAQGIKPSESFDTLAITAGEKNNWHIVDYFNSYNLRQSTINLLLHLAISHRAAQALPLLWHDDCKHPYRKDIEQAFKLAIKNNDLPSVCYLMSREDGPSDSAMAHAFKQALTFSYLDILQTILETKHGNCLQATVNQTFLNAARTNDLTTLKILLTHAQKFLTPKLFDNAFIQTIRSKNTDLFLFMAMLPDYKPSSIAIEHARREAKKFKLIEVENYLTALLKHIDIITIHKKHRKPCTAKTEPNITEKNIPPLKLKPIKNSVSYDTFSPKLSSQRLAFFQTQSQLQSRDSPTKTFQLHK